MTLTVLNGVYSIFQFDIHSELPSWIYKSEFYSITRTNEEISVVTIQTGSFENIRCSRDWKILKIAGPLDFSMVGVIAGISGVLKENNISIFTLSTYDTDYILLQEKDLDAGIKALKKAGYTLPE
jgi:uncharacterized protein